MEAQHGKILLVSLGPGAEEQMTLCARRAIASADLVVGYHTYVKLIAHLLRGKEVISRGMTEEIERCAEAWKAAREGRTVALISSGDVGVYGMAGPAYELLLQSGWSPDSAIAVEVIPGTSALNAAAALVGAPLTHDFCAISLSDLLTPWPQIARRLEAAGRGDFVIALYNPKSGRRTGQIVEAQRILLQYRDPATPVAVVRSAYRKRQQIRRGRLDRMSEYDIGMLSTVLVGNSDSYWREGLMITPRGYRNKYQGLTGDPHAGERAGCSLSLGLTGWEQRVREYLLADPAAGLPAAADRFDITLAAVLGALAEEGGAGRFRVVRAELRRLPELLAQCRDWGALRASIQNRNGVETELRLAAGALRFEQGWLRLACGTGRITVAADRVASAWFVVQEETEEYSLQLVDRQGESLLQLTLDGGGGLSAYQRARQHFCP